MMNLGYNPVSRHSTESRSALDSESHWIHHRKANTSSYAMQQAQVFLKISHKTPHSTLRRLKTERGENCLGNRHL